MTIYDIENTIRNSCEKVLKDKSVSEETRKRRAIHLVLVGE